MKLTSRMHSHHFIHFHNFIYQRVIYRKISLELCKIWMRQGLRECALTYNVTTLKPPPSWLGDPSIRPCQGSVSGTGSPNFLACHQSLSKGSTPPPPRHKPGKGKAEKISSQERWPALGSPSHTRIPLTPERPVLDTGTGSRFPHTHQGCPESRSKVGSAQQAPPVFLPHHEKQQCHHMKSLLEETHFPPTMSRCHTDLVHHL